MSLIRRALDWFDSTRFWKWFAAKYVGHMTFRLFGYPTFPMRDYFKIRELLATAPKGAVFTFASCDRESFAARLITIFTRGKFGHAGLILVDGFDDIKVVHMKGEGPVVWHLLDLLREIDYIAINQVDLDEDSLETAHSRIAWLMANMENIEYDYEQDLSNGTKFYCSEATYFVLDGLCRDPDLAPRLIMGRPVFDPDQVTNVGKVIYTNHPAMLR